MIIEETKILILDTCKIKDFVAYGGMLYELKQMDILDGKDYQIDNDNDLLMKYKAFMKCETILKKFNVRVANS